MTRTLAVVLSALALGACDVGSVLNNQGGPDGGGGGKMDGQNVKMDGSSANCATLVTNPPTGHQHAVSGAGPGQSCLNSGCHLNGATGAGANPWLWGGTLYKGDGVTPLAGASIIVTPPGGGAPITAISMSDGTFCAATTANNGCVAGAAITNGATTYVSGCPGTNQTMTTQLQAAGGGNCDNCHKTGGAAGITIQLPGVP